MTLQDYIPEGYERIKVVDELFAFFTTNFEPKANVVLFPRSLKGDFDGLAEDMARYFDLKDEEIFIKYGEREKLEEYKETLEDDEIRHALQIILDDMECLYSSRVKTHLRLLTRYRKHTDTYDFHVDGLCQNIDRYMICYTDPVTEYIRNDDVIKINGHDALCRKDAPVYRFKCGDMWKSRVRNKPKNPIDDWWDSITRVRERRAFVHRAVSSDKPRLILVGDKQV